MKRALLAAALCAAALSAADRVAHAADAADPSALLEGWVAAFNAGDADLVTADYTGDATLFGTLPGPLLSGSAGIHAYFAKAAAAKTRVALEGRPAVTMLGGEAAVVAGLYDFSGTRADGKSFTAPARYSFVMVRQGGVWKIAHQHSSLRK